MSSFARITSKAIGRVRSPFQWKISAIALLASIIFHCSSAQNHNQHWADSLFKKGESSLATGAFQDATAAFLASAETYAHLGNDKQLAEAYNYVGTVHFISGRYDLAIGWFEKALKAGKKVWAPQSQDLAALYCNIGGTWAQLRDQPQASYYLEEALRIMEKDKSTDPASLVILYNNLGDIFRLKPDHESQLKYLLQAMVLIQQNDMENLPIAANVYSNLALCYFELDQQDKAILYGEKCLRLQQAILPEGHIDLAATYQNLAYFHADDANETQAVAYTLQAIEILTRHLGPSAPKLAFAYRNLAMLYRDPQKQDACFQKSLAIYRSTLPDTNIEIATQLLLYGTFLMDDTPQLDRAEETLRQASEIHLKLQPAPNTAAANCLARIRQIKSAQNEPEAALEYAQAALNTLAVDFKSKDFRDNPPMEALPGGWTDILILSGKANCLLDLIQAAETKARQDAQAPRSTMQDMRIAALASFDLALKIWNRNQDRLVESENPEALRPEINGVYNQAITLAIAMYRQTGDLKYLELAFQRVEQHGASTYLMALKQSNAKKFAGIDPSLLSLERKLKTDIAYYERKLWELQPHSADPEIIRLKDLLVERENAFALLHQHLKKTFPNYHRLRSMQAAVPLAEIQGQLLDPKSLLLEYYVAKDSIFAFGISQQEAIVVSIPWDAALRNDLAALRKSLVQTEFIHDMQGGYDAFVGPAQALYQKLMAPLESALPFSKYEHLLIVPDGELLQLPFEVLLRKPVSKTFTPYRELPYLIRDFSMRYAHSASLQHQRAKQTPSANAITSLAICPDAGGPSRTTPHNIAQALPGANREVEAIGKYFPTQVLRGSAATERNFKQQAHGFRLLHLAMHGLADAAFPMNSHLRFHDEALQDPGHNVQDSITREDGFLYPYEIYNLSLQADLAVLSACETGVGQLLPGEGINSLSRAFEFAGCHNIVPSLWQIDDHSTAAIMETFYKELAAGSPKNIALRKAKLTYLEGAIGTEGHPFYWAGAILMGDAAPIVHRNDSASLWFLVLLAVAITGLILWFGNPK